ncbi:MAG: diadenylate cyclase CdaA [Candidatus Binatia bacterium]
MDVLDNFRLQDAVDIGIVAFIVYSLIQLIRGTRAARMLIGLSLVVLLYLSSRVFDLYTVNWILDNFLSSVLLVIVIIFQHDIRRALIQVGSRRFFGGATILRGQDLEEILRAVVTLAGRRLGALLVLERETGLNEFIEGGITIDAEISKELIVSIFLPASPIHDGALIVRKGRVTAAGCFLPLTTNPNVSKTFGSRHRAAIGITEESDAVVVAVSEETGAISLVADGRLTRDLDAGALRNTLQKLVV